MAFILYADDTSLFISDNDLIRASNCINSELHKINSWFVANKLLLNFSKTNLIIFQTKNKYLDLSQMKIYIDDKEIHMTESVKFLGVKLDSKLTWKDHIDEISRKISCVIGILSRIKHILPMSVLIKLYNAAI